MEQKSPSKDPLESLQSKIVKTEHLVVEDEKLRFWVVEGKEILEELKKDPYRNIYYQTLNVLHITCVVIFLTHIILKGYWVGLAGIVLSLILFLASRIILKSKILNRIAYPEQIDSGKLLQKEDLSVFLDYLDDGLEIKRKRFQLLRLNLMVLLPLLFLAGNEMILGSLSLVSILLAVLFGSVIWIFYFMKEFRKLGMIEDKIEKIDDYLED